MTHLTFHDIFANAMVFHTTDGLLYRSAVRFSELFETSHIDYFIVGGYALIHHGVVRNTTDIDIIVNEDHFVRAAEILINIGYMKSKGDQLCARFEHEKFLPVDLFVSPLFAPNPDPSTRVHYERSIFFCTLPILVQTKVKAMLGRPLEEETIVKRIRDHADICDLIVHHKMPQTYATSNNMDIVVQAAFERVHCDLYDQLKPSKSKEKQQDRRHCICQ